MNLKEIYNHNNKKIPISFEFFPEENSENMLKSAEILKKFNPELVSLTYSVKNGKFAENILKKLVNDFNVMPHLTCICNSFENVNSALNLFENLEIQNILALRGDIPDDKTLCNFDFHYANELVNYIKQKKDFSIAVAGYPEGHMESLNINADIENLKKKVDEGADVIYTQLFFDNTKLYSYIDRIQKKGINIPVVAGIMPILSQKQIEKMTNLAKISLPDEVFFAINNYDNLFEFGIEYATKQCKDLIENQIQGLHFYTLNRYKSVEAILNNIKEKL